MLDPEQTQDDADIALKSLNSKPTQETRYGQRQMGEVRRYNTGHHGRQRSQHSATPQPIFCKHHGKRSLKRGF